jgi:hypothetical protein
MARLEKKKKKLCPLDSSDISSRNNFRLLVSKFVVSERPLAWATAHRRWKSTGPPVKSAGACNAWRRIGSA